ncbi:toll/interleukin-1 receptor domain-containing protein [Pontiellaceae bacterium B12219]|nr:toll/interleukin-1 receptor domain-containing protein [Pontiellaceae bacterium B12219]
MVQIFISYCHADDAYRAELEAHLSMLKKNKHVTSWTDRCIVGGEDWSKEISTKLEQAHIILLLISVDFLKSDYCYEVEAKRALERHKAGDSVIIPIVLRHCDWKESPFGRIQGYPKNAHPIKAWSDKDEAWLNVIDGIKDSISKFRDTLVIAEVENEVFPNCDSPLKEEFSDWLDDTEVEIAHHRADSVGLRDIFVYPDIKILGGDATKVSKCIESSDNNLFTGFHLIFGSEQAGKTSLAKQLFCDVLKQGLNPVLFNGERIKTSEIDKLLKPVLNNQYADLSVEAYKALPNKVLIIDDYACTTVNLKYQNILLKLLKDEFTAVIVLAIDAFQYVASDIDEFDNFLTYELLPFGNVKREELVHKWVELGNTEEISEQELYKGIDSLVIHIDSFVRKNIVPSKPIYLLAILQTYQSFMPHGLDLTSNGHCYQYLIYRSLEQAKINPSEIDTYLEPVPKSPILFSPQNQAGAKSRICAA